MPASPTRKCPSCDQDRLIAEFRDADDVTWGRPPKFCRFCRAESDELQAHQAWNRDRRPSAVEKQREYAARSVEKRLADQAYAHPDGLKHCPPRSGCDTDRSLDQFMTNISQFDGLFPVCRDCSKGYENIVARVVVPE